MKKVVTSKKCLTKLLVITVLSIALVLTGLVAQTSQAHAATSRPLLTYSYNITEQPIPFFFLDPEDNIFVPIPGTMQGSVRWAVAHSPEANLNQINGEGDATWVSNVSNYPATVYVNSYIIANNGTTTINGNQHNCGVIPGDTEMICNQTTHPFAVTSPIFQHTEVATTDGAGLLASNNFTHNWNLV